VSVWEERERRSNHTVPTSEASLPRHFVFHSAPVSLPYSRMSSIKSQLNNLQPSSTCCSPPPGPSANLPGFVLGVNHGCHPVTSATVMLPPLLTLARRPPCIARTLFTFPDLSSLTSGSSGEGSDEIKYHERKILPYVWS
jgi:hypothetical protein